MSQSKIISLIETAVINLYINDDPLSINKSLCELDWLGNNNENILEKIVSNADIYIVWFALEYFNEKQFSKVTSRDDLTVEVSLDLKGLRKNESPMNRDEFEIFYLKISAVKHSKNFSLIDFKLISEYYFNNQEKIKKKIAEIVKNSSENQKSYQINLKKIFTKFYQEIFEK